MLDQYWLNICNSVASNSKCLSRKVGAIIVKDNKFIISTGYSGPPSKCPHCDDLQYREYLFDLWWRDSKSNHLPSDMDSRKCPRQLLGYKSGEGLQYCGSAHAERNCIDIAARLGHVTENCAIYINTNKMPCFECCKSIINAGIIEVVTPSLEDYEQRGLTGKYLLDQAGIKIRQYEI